MEVHRIYRIRFFDGQEITAKFIRVEKLENEMRFRYKFVIGLSITIRVHESEFSIIEKIENDLG